ncbi:GIY-YIG nuclease family protein [Fodinibius halophilus]|uniref:GIY-YIG nuclease family protein n=1 Tax=Fodinibius halophilus TaxID=1736908 RepID=A0A6M1T7L5_9BACT|nr:GIY-YIG nuclease family protein [Fodinibius halophilus]NGP90237.1 GIY-YIG nuclease family protein [Fodinibius halophilus]
MARYYVYIMSNISKMIYTGMTNSLTRRVREHKEKVNEGFTKRYNIHRLVYYEEFQDVREAIAREKEIKGWRREKKVALIEKVNPKWKDLAANE